MSNEPKAEPTIDEARAQYVAARRENDAALSAARSLREAVEELEQRLQSARAECDRAWGALRIAETRYLDLVARSTP